MELGLELGHYCSLGETFSVSSEEFPSGTDEEALGTWRKWNLSDCPVSEKFLPGLQDKIQMSPPPRSLP